MGIPSEYVQVAYIETDGNQYIDTGVLASNYPDGISYKFEGNITDYIATNNTNYLFGALASGVRAGNLIILPSLGSDEMCVYCGTTTSYALRQDAPGIGRDFVVTLLATSESTNASATINGQEFYSPSTISVADMPDANVYLFWCSGLGSSSTSRKYFGKLYGFTMDSADGTPIRCFVPCYRVSDGEIGLYDTVEGKFYTNAGTGSFSKGNAIDGVYEIYTIRSTTLQEIADSIRSKTGSSSTIAVKNFADAISTITTDGTLDGKDKPTTLGQAACLARAVQLRDIEFTPAASLACVGKTYAAGTTVKGIPYSSTRDTDKFVGFGVSLDTFMDAVRNPNSVLYTKQTSGISNAKTWYGMNCSVFVSYCWDLPYHNATAVLHKLDYVEQVEPENMKLCDAPIVYSASGGSGGHATLITGIERDSDGVIQYVTISHSTTAISNDRYLYSVRMTYDQFVSSYINQGYRVYRYKKLYDTTYEPSVYTPQFDEPVIDVEYSDITTDLGNRATILTSETITLQPIVSDGYTGIKLYRDGVEINSYNVGNVVLSDLVAGKYVAKLFPESDNASVSFIVSDVRVTQDGTRYTFSGSGGIPQRIVFKDSENYTLHIVELSEMDILNGYVDVDYSDDDVSVVCVPFKNEYGFNVAKTVFTPIEPETPSAITLTAADFGASNMYNWGDPEPGSTGYNRVYTLEPIALDGNTISIDCPSPYQHIVYFSKDSTFTQNSLAGKTSFASGSRADITAATLASGSLSGATHCRISLRDSTNTNANLSERIAEFAAAVTVTITKKS